jgi:hypothetical protein
MTDPPRRRPGRPPLAPDDVSVPVYVSLPGKQFAACEASAKREHVSVPQWIRLQLRAAVTAKVTSQP